MDTKYAANHTMVEENKKCVSPTSSSLPKVIKRNFSKLRSKPSSSQSSVAAICAKMAFKSSNEFMSPENEEIVKDSLKNGLPIIPFALPRYLGTKEEAEPRKGKTSLQHMIRKSNSEHWDTSSSTWDNHKLESKICDKSLETFLRIAKEEMQIQEKVC
jgi:hypothetical protein